MEVAFKDIKIGQTYGIKYKGIHPKITATCILNRGSFGIFNTKIHYVWNNEYRTIDNQSTYYANVGYRFFLLDQKEKIQEAMELRSYHKIMENLLGHSI